MVGKLKTNINSLCNFYQLQILVLVLFFIHFNISDFYMIHNKLKF